MLCLIPATDNMHLLLHGFGVHKLNLKLQDLDVLPGCLGMLLPEPDFMLCHNLDMYQPYILSCTLFSMERKLGFVG